MRAAGALPFFVIGVVVLLAACQPATLAPPTETATSLPIPTVTATQVWFPPTDTPTLANTPLPPTATPLPPSGLGPVLITDDFSTHKLWQTGRMDAGNIAYGSNELTLAVAQSKGSLVSLREQTALSDFYLEITLTPSLCQDDDQFGVLFRATSSIDFYRFLVSCAGQMRLERLVNGQGTLLQGWTLSLQLLSGTPAAHRLGIWAVGKDLRFYIDNTFQFRVTDSILAAGTIGLYARSMGVTAVTGTFSDLVVYQVTP